MQVDGRDSLEKPENGLRGLKHWRHDLLAGMVVSLISVPFSLGIAVASGAPPICGLISAIIAGLVLPFLGGSYVTVSGPAAGLAPALLAAMMLLGRGDRQVGYPLLLVAICLTGLAQVILARLRAARFAAIFPASVVEGMLAAIGLLIIAKQLPLLVGHHFESHEFWGILGEAPRRILSMDVRVFAVGLLCLALIFVLASLRTRWLKIVPPQVIAAAVGLLLGRFMGLGGEHLVNIPDAPFARGLTLPNFGGAFADPTLWWSLGVAVLTLTMIDGVESLATIAAIDKIDPFRRKSDPDRTLLAMGVSNIASSLVGGLTIIPGGVKSTACIVSGGRTQWANFYNSCFLILYVLLGRPVINLMPMSALGAIVIYTGYKLCAPRVWRHIAHIGSEQLFVFTATVLVTVSTDLLWGIAAGILAKFLLEAAIQGSVLRSDREAAEPIAQVARRWMSQAGELLRNPVLLQDTVGDVHHLYFGRPIVCFNALHLERELDRIPTGVSSVEFHVTDLVTLMDHTASATLLDFVEDFRRTGRGRVEIRGLDQLRGVSHALSCLRVSCPVLDAERRSALTELARIGSDHSAEQVRDPVAFLDGITLRHLAPAEGWTDDLTSGFPGGQAQRLARRFQNRIDGLRRFIDRDDLEDYQTVRDLAWVSLNQEDDTRFFWNASWFGLPGQETLESPSNASAGFDDRRLM